MPELFVPIFVHCHECQGPVSPSGRAVRVRGEFRSFSSSAMIGLCLAMRRKRGVVYQPPGVVG